KNGCALARPRQVVSKCSFTLGKLRFFAESRLAWQPLATLFREAAHTAGANPAPPFASNPLRRSLKSAHASFAHPSPRHDQPFRPVHDIAEPDAGSGSAGWSPAWQP